MIYYLGYYNCEQIAAEKRVAAPPAMNKMGYVISVLSEIVEDKAMVVSPSETSAYRFMRGSVQKIHDRIWLKTFDSLHSRNKLLRGIGHKMTKAQLLWYLLKHVTARDTLIVYHSLVLMELVEKIKHHTGCCLIIEVEELYSDVRGDGTLRKKEIDYLQIADQYIVITELLNQEVNLSDKPYIISHGTYHTVPRYCGKFDDGKVHVVYAGSFNPVKGGALTAIGAAEYLDENYVLHILGKGSDEATAAVRRKIDETVKKTGCKIIFEGYKTGREFDSFIQSCHIGLSTQQPDGKYNASSFPSKILMYMSNGLPVVSVRIPAVATSGVKDYIYYYDAPIPEDIAGAIKQVPVGDTCDPAGRLMELHATFSRNLRTLVEK